MLSNKSEAEEYIKDSTGEKGMGRQSRLRLRSSLSKTLDSQSMEKRLSLNPENGQLEALVILPSWKC